MWIFSEIATFIKRFHLWNFFVLLLFGLIFRVYDTISNPIKWPVSYFLSLFLLGTLAFYLRSWMTRPSRIVISTITFAGLHWILTGFLEIVLTRFFRLTEEYSFVTFDLYLADHWTRLLDGAIWFGMYWVLFHVIRLSIRLDAVLENQKNMEEDLRMLDLNALNKEMSPHFLFNAMNGVAMKIRMKENTTAVNMVAALTDLLRLNLSKQGDGLISVREEIELLDKYLLIEQTRFGEQFVMEVEFPETLMDLKVPQLILQPLVENAFKHGMQHQFDQMVVKIDGQSDGERLSLAVYNSMVDHSNINFAKSNVGIPNIVHRLRRYYGTNFRFQSYSASDGVVFKITIPQVS